MEFDEDNSGDIGKWSRMIWMKHCFWHIDLIYNNTIRTKCYRCWKKEKRMCFYFWKFSPYIQLAFSKWKLHVISVIVLEFQSDAIKQI